MLGYAREVLLYVWQEDEPLLGLVGFDLGDFSIEVLNIDAVSRVIDIHGVILDGRC